MKYKITLNGRTYEVEVEAGRAMLTDEYDPAEIEKELWPVVPDDIKEFEEELMDLDLRF